MEACTAAGWMARSAPPVEAGRPRPLNEGTAVRRFLLVSLFLVGIWALLTAVADRASAEEDAPGGTLELLESTESSDLPDQSGELSPDGGSDPVADPADQPDAPQAGPPEPPA